MKGYMKHLLVSLLLVVALAVPASAAFSDVQESDWFYDELQLMVDKGIISGYEDGSFRPQNTVTMGEVSKMLYLFWGYDALANGSDHWADNYAAAVDSLNWMEQADDLNQSATRLEVAEAVLNSIGALADPWVDNPYADVDSDIADTLYDMGIMQGSVDANGTRTLSPDAAITRAEFCAILNRTYLYMTESYGVTDFRYLLPQVFAPSETPEMTSAYFENLFLYMLANDVTEYTVVLYDTSINQVQNSYETMVNEAFWAMQEGYHELGAFFDSIYHSYSSWGSTVTWSISLKDGDFSVQDSLGYRYNFLMNISYWAQEVYDLGYLDPASSDYDIAKYFYNYCATSFQYDNNFNAISYNGYGIVHNKTGVCQAYVSAYNALCKIWGIDIIGVQGTAGGGNHIWSYANLDGTWYYIDPTWGDPTPDRPGYCDYSYFALTYEEISKTHTFG